MKYIFILNELSILPFLWRVLVGKKVYLLQVSPVLFIFRWAIRKIAKWSIDTGRALPLKDLAPNGDLICADGAEAESIGWSPKLYPIVDSTVSKLAPREIDLGINSYELAALKAANTYGETYLHHAKIISDFLDSSSDLEVTVLGAERLFYDILDRVGGIPERLHGYHFKAVTFFNLLSSLIVIICSIAWVVWRTRFWLDLVYTATIIVDVTPPFYRTRRIIESFIESNSPNVMYVLRSANAFPQLKDENLKDVKWANIDEGCFPVRKLPSLIWDIIHDSLVLLIRYRHQGPAQFVQTARLVFIAIKYRGFLNRYEFDAYLGQDEMNPDHIIRTREIRRAGRTSMGIINGEASNGFDFTHRYIDYDFTYLVSDYTIRKYLRPYWPGTGSLRPVGSIRCVAADTYAARHEATRSGVLFFVKPREEGGRGVSEVHAFAKAFPELPITLAIKKIPRERIPDKRWASYSSAVARLPANVSVSYENSYELVLRHKYVVSTMSSMITESIHLEAKTFFLDIYPDHFSIIYRDFPNIRCRNGEEVASRISALEEGKERYPWDELEGFSVIKGANFPEVISKDLEESIRKRNTSV